MIARPEAVHPPQPALRAELGRLIDHHGPVRTLIALLASLAMRPARTRALAPADLSTHLRRDIGLGPPLPDPGRDYTRYL